MNAYRSALISTFTNVAALPNEEFHRVLAGTQNAALDAALRDLRWRYATCSKQPQRKRSVLGAQTTIQRTGRPGILFGVIGVGCSAVAILAASESADRHRRLAGRDDAVATANSAADIEAETSVPTITVARTITWPALVDPEAGQLTEAERLHLIEGLGIVGDARSANILTTPSTKKNDDAALAVVEALGTCDSDIVEPTLERAYASHAIAERYAAIDGASRRGDVALSERALRDADGAVALAAAYGLHRAERNDLVERELTGRNDANATEIRNVLPMLV